MVRFIPLSLLLTAYVSRVVGVTPPPSPIRLSLSLFFSLFLPLHTLRHASICSTSRSRFVLNPRRLVPLGFAYKYLYLYLYIYLYIYGDMNKKAYVWWEVLQTYMSSCTWPNVKSCEHNFLSSLDAFFSLTSSSLISLHECIHFFGLSGLFLRSIYKPDTHYARYACIYRCEEFHNQWIYSRNT